MHAGPVRGARSDGSRGLAGEPARRRHRRGQPEPAQPGRRLATRGTGRSSTGCSPQLTSERLWAACAGCELARTCYAPHNARTFAHPSAGPKVTGRLRDLYRLVHLRGQLHVTLRDLRSALAFMLTSGRDCAQIHELYRTGNAEEILSSFYFNSWLGDPGTRRPAAAPAARARRRRRSRARARPQARRRSAPPRAKS